MSNREYGEKGQQYGGGTLTEFKKFRKWYIKHREEWQESLKTETEETTHPTLPFESFSQLNESLRQMGGDA